MSEKIIDFSTMYMRWVSTPEKNEKNSHEIATEADFVFVSLNMLQEHVRANIVIAKIL